MSYGFCFVLFLGTVIAPAASGSNLEHRKVHEKVLASQATWKKKF